LWGIAPFGPSATYRAASVNTRLPLLCAAQTLTQRVLVDVQFRARGHDIAEVPPNSRAK
jgi:hypothetical protein